MKTQMPTDAGMKPMIHMDGEHAAPFAKRKVGDKVQFHGHGVVKNISQRDGGEGPEHSVGIEVHGFKHKKKAMETGKVEDKMADGGKLAMDAALDGQEAETAQAAGSDD